MMHQRTALNTSLFGLRGLLLAMGFLLGTSFFSAAQSTDAQANLNTNTNKQLVGDQAHVTLEVQHDPSISKIIWPGIPDSFGKLEVVRKEKIDTVKKGRFVSYSQTMQVAGFDSGMFVIPPFVVTVAPVAGQPYELRTDSVMLLVQTVAVDTTKAFKGIKGIMEVKASWLDYIWWYVGALALLIVLGLVWYFLKKKKPVVVAAPPPPEALHIRVLRQLDALERDQVWEKGDVKAYYVRLTEILRGYIEDRFQVPAMERTTDELVGMARRNAGLAPHAEKIYNVLFTADFAKFARAQPSPSEHIATMQAVREFVTATIPTPVVEAPKNPNQS